MKGTMHSLWEWAEIHITLHEETETGLSDGFRLEALAAIKKLATTSPSSLEFTIYIAHNTSI